MSQGRHTPSPEPHVQAALKSGEFDLAAELLRFLIPPGQAEAFLAAASGANGVAAAEPAPAKPASQGVRFIVSPSTSSVPANVPARTIQES